ncbi:MAG TPA: ribosome-associated translation inhibitor RaiA [Bryobacteraceae bacterium]|jgi:ribosomal subunit interface protein
MKINYTGRHMALAPSQTVELEAEFEKLAKLLDTQKGEAQAHVVFSHEHGSNQAEVTVAWRHHEVAAQAENADLFTAIHQAVEKVRAQIVKQREKMRDTKRVAAQ